MSNSPQDQCLDVQADSISKPAQPYGSLKDVQTWRCASGNANQVRLVCRRPLLMAQLWTTTKSGPDTKYGTITPTATPTSTNMPWGAYTITGGPPVGA